MPMRYSHRAMDDDNIKLATAVADKLKRFIHRNALGLVLVTTFLVVWLVGQTTAGLHVYNQQRSDAGLPTVGWSTYLATAHFGEATFENWESEFLQMAMFVVLTVKFRQWGSAESKPLEGETDVDEDPRLHRNDPDAPWPVRRGGWLLAIYRRSLSLAFLALFLASFALHAVTGSRAYNAEQDLSGRADHTTGWSYLSFAVLVRVAPELAVASSSRSPPSCCCRSCCASTGRPSPSLSTHGTDRRRRRNARDRPTPARARRTRRPTSPCHT